MMSMVTSWDHWRVAGDPGFAGVAGGAQLADVGFEVLGADPGPAQHPGPFPDLGGADPQDHGQPSGAGVQPGFVAQPLEPVAGQARTRTGG